MTNDNDLVVQKMLTIGTCRSVDGTRNSHGGFPDLLADLPEFPGRMCGDVRRHIADILDQEIAYLVRYHQLSPPKNGYENRPMLSKVGPAILRYNGLGPPPFGQVREHEYGAGKNPNCPHQHKKGASYDGKRCPDLSNQD